jgi:hypothetical protein
MDIDYTAADRMFMQQKQLQNAITEEISLKSNTKSRWQWTTGVFTSYQWLRTDAPVYFYKAMSDAISQQIYNTIYQAAYNVQYNAMYDVFIRKGMSEAQAAAQAEATTKQNLEPFRFNIIWTRRFRAPSTLRSSTSDSSTNLTSASPTASWLPSVCATTLTTCA